jgi:hypothetical protein
MAKFLRKIYLISNIKYNLLLIKNNPTHLSEFLNFLNSPIIHKFTNPCDNQIIEEKQNPRLPLFKILYFIFFKNIDFGLNKKKKRAYKKKNPAKINY